MVVNKLLLNMIDLGFTEYEAKAYIALLSAKSATAYEIARISGIPTSKIYEVISKLTDKGIIFSLNNEEKNKYIPLKPEEFIESRRHRYENTLNTVKTELQNIAKEPDISYIWNLHEYDYLLDKTKRIVKEAASSILLSAWPEEISYIKEALKQKEKSGVKISIIHFGEINFKIGQLFSHPIEDTIYSEKGGRGLTIVADSKEALIATIFQNNQIEGGWSINKGFVTLAEDYIKHDIYIMKIVKRFDKLLIKRFGQNYKKLRDIYNDNEEK